MTQFHSYVELSNQAYHHKNANIFVIEEDELGYENIEEYVVFFEGKRLRYQSKYQHEIGFLDSIYDLDTQTFADWNTIGVFNTKEEAEKALETHKEVNLEKLKSSSKEELLAILYSYWSKGETKKYPKERDEVMREKIQELFEVELEL